MSDYTVRYWATDVRGNTLPVELKGEYCRPVVAGLCWSHIGVVKVPTPLAEISQVLFFDDDGTMFWASEGEINPYIKEVQPSYMITPVAKNFKECLEYNNSAMIG